MKPTLVHLEPEHRFSGRDDSPVHRLDLVREVREDLAEGPAEMRFRGGPVDGGHRHVDAHEAEIRVHQAQADGRGPVELDDLGEALSTSRSALIRRAIDDMLKRASGSGPDGDAYERIPLDTPDEWGNLADWLAAARQVRSE